MITYPLTASLLQSDKSYKLEIIHADNVNATTASFTGAPDASSNVPVQEAGSSALYTLFFRVSNYDTFSDKIAAIQALSTEETLNDTRLQKDLADVEPFDDLELGDNPKYEQLVQFSADLSNSWIIHSVRPVLDRLSSWLCRGTTSDPIEDLEYTIGVYNTASISLSESDFNAGTSPSAEQQLQFNLALAAADKLKEWQDRMMSCNAEDIANYADECYDSDDGCIDINELIELEAVELPALQSNTYFVDATYTLPGKGGTNAVRQMSFVKE